MSLKTKQKKDVNTIFLKDMLKLGILNIKWVENRFNFVYFTNTKFDAFE